MKNLTDAPVETLTEDELMEVQGGLRGPFHGSPDGYPTSIEVNGQTLQLIPLDAHTPDPNTVASRPPNDHRWLVGGTYPLPPEIIIPT